MSTTTTLQAPIADVLGVLFAGAVRGDQTARAWATPNGFLGRTLLAHASARQSPTQEEVLTACETELVLRYGCDVTRIALLGAADGLLAVAFDANTLRNGSGDPVDVLAPWREDVCNWEPLRSLSAQIDQMLQMNSWGHSRWQAVVEAMQKLALTPPATGLARSLLWRQVCAANIRLAVRRAQ